MLPCIVQIGRPIGFIKLVQFVHFIIAFVNFAMSALANREHWVIFAAPHFSVQHVRAVKKDATNNKNVTKNHHHWEPAAQKQAWKLLCEYQDKHVKYIQTTTQASMEQPQQQQQMIHAVKLLAKSKQCIGYEKKQMIQHNDDNDDHTSSSSSSSDEEEQGKWQQVTVSFEQVQQENKRIVQRERQKDNQSSLLL